MTAEQARNINDLVCTHRRQNLLGRRSDRLFFAKHLCSITNYFSVSEMLLFLDEMRGLDLRQSEDQEVFKSFLHCWLGFER